MAIQKEERRADGIIEFREGNISLILDSYNDIFSNFDPRPFSEKALSDDFLFECKKASIDKEDRLELRLLVPKNKRDYKDEIKIKKRLREHFQRHQIKLEKEINGIRLKGIGWFILGAILMIIGTFLYTYKNINFFYNLAIIIIEPAGWFTFWEGLGMIFFTTNEKMPDYKFYKKMSKSEVVFLDY